MRQALAWMLGLALSLPSLSSGAAEPSLAEPLPRPPSVSEPPPLVVPAERRDPPAWGPVGRSYFRFEGSVGPAIVGVFPQNPPPPDPPSLDPAWMPAPNTCGWGGQLTVGFRHVSPYRPYPDGFLGSLLKIPVLGWILAVPLIPIVMASSSVVSGDQAGLDLRFGVYAPCGSEGVRYALGLRPVLRTSPPRSRLRLPAFLGAILPEPLVIFEGGQPVTLELGLLRFPVGVLLTEHLGVEIEPTLGYRFSFTAAIPSAVTLGLTAALVVR